MFDIKNKISYFTLSVINLFLAYTFYYALVFFCIRLLIIEGDNFLFNLEFSILFGAVVTVVSCTVPFLIGAKALKDKEITLDMWRDLFLKSFKVWIFPYFMFAVIWNKIVKNKERII